MKDRITCYSDGESRFMAWSQALRAKGLNPLLGFLADRGWRANHLTLLSLLAGFAFCPLYLLGFPGPAFACLLGHVILDGIDGPLARFRGQASNRGSFTDTMADQVVVTVTLLALIQSGTAGAWPGGLYLFFYTLVVGFALVRNALMAPYSWLFRPRFLVYAWFALETYLWPQTLDFVLWASAGILAAKSVTGFFTIRRHL